MSKPPPSDPPMPPTISSSRVRNGRFYGKKKSSSDRDDRHSTAGGPGSRVGGSALPLANRDININTSNSNHAFIPPIQPHHQPSRTLTQASTSSVPLSLPLLHDTTHATTSARRSEVVNVDCEEVDDEDDDNESRGVLEMATADDRNKAQMELRIYDKMRIELNGREITSGDRAGTRHSVDSLKLMLQKLIEHRAAVLTMAEIVGTLGGLKGDMYNHLHSVYPEKVSTARITKAEMAEHFLKIWKVFNLVWTYPDIKVQTRQVVQHDIEGYYTMMTALYSRCKLTIHSEVDSETNEQSMKMPAAERFRGYLQDNATLPEKDFQKCPSCLECYMHEPPENDEIRANNAEEMRKYNEDLDKLAKYQQQVARNGTGTNKRKKGAVTPPLDRFGKEMTTKVPIMKLEPLLLVCKVGTLVDQSHWGWTCPTPGCTLRSCHLCTSMCQFVCNTE